MAKAVITKALDVVEVTSNTLDVKYSKVAQNVVTGFWVALCGDDSGVHSNLLCIDKVAYNHLDIDSVDGNTTASNSDLYDELKAIL